MKISEKFDEAFLKWFKQKTEETWKNYVTTDFFERGTGGLDWQKETQWLSGLSNTEISRIELQWDLTFPPDYRLFLKTLHTVDRSMAGAFYTNSNQMESKTGPSFYNWTTETKDLEAAHAQVLEGIYFDVERNNLWLSSWGSKQNSSDHNRAHLRQLVAKAPKLIPIFGHRFLLVEPCIAGNPILSIHQSDIIIYGSDLRQYFLVEFSDLLDLDERKPTKLTDKASIDDFHNIPFWGELIS